MFQRLMAHLVCRGLEMGLALGVVGVARSLGSALG